MDDIGHMLEPRTHAQFGRGEYCVTHIVQIQNLRTHVHIQCSQSDKQLHLTWLLPFSNRARKRACVETFTPGELAPFHSVVIEHPRYEGEVFEWRGVCTPVYVCNAI